MIIGLKPIKTWSHAGLKPSGIDLCLETGHRRQFGLGHTNLKFAIISNPEIIDKSSLKLFKVPENAKGKPPLHLNQIGKKLMLALFLWFVCVSPSLKANDFDQSIITGILRAIKGLSTRNLS